MAPALMGNVVIWKPGSVPATSVGYLRQETE
jgi:hypothetical protein